MSTTLSALEGNTSIFLAVGHCPLELLSIHTICCDTGLDVLEFIRRTARRSFDMFCPEVSTAMILRHDNGSRFVSSVYRDEVRILRIANTLLFDYRPHGNGFAERFVRILKKIFPLPACVRLT